VNGDEIRDVRFLDGGYDAAQVDDLLRRISVELDEGRPAGPLIAGAAFRPAMITPQRAGVMFRRIGPRGYDTEAVDWFLDQLRGRENYSEPPEMGADPWRDLPVATGSPRFRGARRCGVTLLLTTSEDYDRWVDPAVRSRR
jgi:DivIVA domain-containing protein